MYLLQVQAKSIAVLELLECLLPAAGEDCRTIKLYKATCLPLVPATVMHHNVLRASSATEMEILLAEDHVIRALVAGTEFVTKRRSALTVVGRATRVLRCARMAR